MLYSKFQKISRLCSCNFTQFHTIFTQFGLFQPFLGQFQHVGYQNACTRAEKFIGSIRRGHRAQEGAEGPKEEAEGLQTGPKAPLKPSAGARIMAPGCQYDHVLDDDPLMMSMMMFPMDMSMNR